MKHREFQYVGKPVPEFKEREYTAFFQNMQRAILFSLEKRHLLTAAQREECLRVLERHSRFSWKNEIF